jgi:hypothetical protein
MIVPYTYNTPEPEKITWLYALALILIVTAIAGREAIAWLLMKLYEFFIQKTPLQL